MSTDSSTIAAMPPAQLVIEPGEEGNKLNATAPSEMHFNPIKHSDSCGFSDGMGMGSATNSEDGVSAMDRNVNMGQMTDTKKFDLSLKGFLNPNSAASMESPSPAGSIAAEYEAAVTPLSPEDDMDGTGRETSLLNSGGCSVGNRSGDLMANNPSFKFRRHSSQSSLNMAPSTCNNMSSGSASASLTLLPTTGSLSTTSLSERICSSPVNSLKMSSRVCQIKIDEGIGAHLREIRSERETQNTLKLKSSCDELMINNEELELSFDGRGGNGTTNDTLRYSSNSPNSMILPTSTTTTFRRYRTFSETLGNGASLSGANAGANGSSISGGGGGAGNNSQSNMPSPSMSSCYSYSNSSSPTGCINPPSVTPNSGGLLRCFSPSTAGGSVASGSLLSAQQSLANQGLQNYFSKSPSPTRKLFVTRRSMSPIPYALRPSTLNTNPLSLNASSNNKRKFSDIETDLPDAQSACSPKRSNNDSQQEFVQPLLINTKNVLTSQRSTASSPLSAATTPLSQSQSSSLSSLIITAAGPSSEKSAQNSGPTDKCDSADKDKGLFVWPSKPCQQQDDEAAKYTFVPIQLPPPRSTSPFLLNPPPSSSHLQSMQQQQRKRSSVGVITTCTSFSALAQLNLQTNNSPLNSPARFSCDSPVSYSPSVSNVSSSNGHSGHDKPDSGYQSSLQNNSDSESCN